MFSKRKVVNSLTSNPRNITAHIPEGEAGSDDYYKMLTELAAKSCELYLLRTFIYRTKKQNIWPIERAVASDNSLIVNEADLKKMYDSLMNVRNKVSAPVATKWIVNLTYIIRIDTIDLARFTPKSNRF